MKNVLFLIAILLFSKSWGQCSHTWSLDRNDTGVINSFSERSETDQVIIGVDGYKLNKCFLDSLVDDIKSKPYYFYVKDQDTIKQFIDNNFKIYRLKARDIVHYSMNNVLVGIDSIKVHRFEYCEKEWNEDYRRNYILYSTEFGILGRGWSDVEDPFGDTYWVTNNSCLSKEKNIKMETLIKKCRKAH